MFSELGLDVTNHNIERHRNVIRWERRWEKEMQAEMVCERQGRRILRRGQIMLD